jgi:hypothetical protein
MNGNYRHIHVMNDTYYPYIICEKETTGKIGMNKKYSNGFYTFKQAMLMALFTR